MKQRDLSLVGLILLVVFGVRFMPQSGAVAGTPTSAKRSQTATTQTTETPLPKLPELWATLCKLNPSYVAKSYLGESPLVGDIDGSAPDPDCLKDLPAGRVVAVIARQGERQGSENKKAAVGCGLQAT